jgi:cbb3-type cytochrome c oxidase subunit III
LPRRRRDWTAGAAEALIVMVAIGLAFVAGIAGWAIGHAGRSAGTAVASTTRTSTSAAQGAAVDPSVAAGAHDFVQFACAKCHGEQGRGGVSPDVPALTNAKDLTPGQLREIIDHGLGESANPKKPFMPVWGNVISTRQVDELVSYLRAGLPFVPTATPLPIPRNQGLAVAGAALYVSDGCINCHGPNGLGGVPNPQSEDKAIPPLSGVDFRGEFNTDAKIIDFIRTGSVLGRAPIVSMPHWGGIISDQELNALVAYLKTLK